MSHNKNLSYYKISQRASDLEVKVYMNLKNEPETEERNFNERFGFVAVNMKVLTVWFSFSCCWSCSILRQSM
jgi:hypothetical protein